MRLRLVRLAVIAAAALAAAPPAVAQEGDDSILVTGRRLGGEGAAMSDWRVAETQNVIVFAREDEARLARVAHDLEKLHFLLSVLLDRVDTPEDPIKLRLILFGDAADFRQLDLGNRRWQWGPYPRAFPASLHYDPREDGAVAAAAAADRKILLQPSLTRPSDPNCDRNQTDASFPPSRVGGDAGAAPAPGGPGAPGGPAGAPAIDYSALPLGEIAFCQTAEGRLYSLYAQHYLMTYFPAAYPRWYLQGFGEIFSTFRATGEGAVEYGRAPDGLRQVIEHYGRFPVARVLRGDYLSGAAWPPPIWTPYHAWTMAHLLFFSDEWKAPLHDYLAAVARGAAPEEAAAALDAEKLQREVGAYRGRKIPYEVMTYPPDRIGEPVVRRLTVSEAAYVRGQLELGARVEAASAEEAAARARYLDRLRRDAARYPDAPETQLLLAEAECRGGASEACLAAAERALALAPASSAALAWTGLALARLAIAGPAAARAAGLKAARGFIVRANRANPDAVLPLIAYHRSFAEAGERAPDIAVDGMVKAVERAPSSPTSRLALGRAYAERDLPGEARRTLLPVARGAYDSPERAPAEALLDGLPVPGE